MEIKGLCKEWAVKMSLVAVVALLLAVGGVRGAELVYFLESPRGLYNFDTDTHVSSLRAAMTGTERFFGMDRRPGDGATFAVDLSGGGLWNIDIDTGQKQRIGTLTPAIDRPEGIAFHPLTGELFVSSVLGDLYKVDPATAATTLVGHSGMTLRGHSFSPDGTSFLAWREGAGSVYSVDPATAAATLLGPGVPSNVPEDSTFTPDGQLFVTDFNGVIYRADPVTGATTAIGNTGFTRGLLGLISVPEPATWVLASALTLSMVGRRARK